MAKAEKEMSLGKAMSLAERGENFYLAFKEIKEVLRVAKGAEASAAVAKREQTTAEAAKAKAETAVNTLKARQRSLQTRVDRLDQELEEGKARAIDEINRAKDDVGAELEQVKADAEHEEADIEARLVAIRAEEQEAKDLLAAAKTEYQDFSQRVAAGAGG